MLRYLFLLKNLKKIYFFKPPKKKILIYDHGVDLLIFLDKSEYFVFDARGESLNIYVLFLCLFKYRFKNLIENYKKLYFELVDPKFIISYRCDNPGFFKLKQLIKSAKTISIQWGKPQKYFFEEEYFSKEKKLQADYIFVFGDSVGENFSRLVECRTISLGGLVNNYFKFDDNIQKNTMIFISQHKNRRLFPKAEELILKLLKEFCDKKNIHLFVSSRVREDDHSGKDPYEKILGKHNWTYCPRKSFSIMGDYLAYKNVMTKEYVVFVDSTLGYEAIGRNKKIIVFPLGCDDKEWCKTNYLFSKSPEEIYYPTSFAYPLIFPSIGPFWCSKYDKQKMNDILNFVTTRSDEEWKEIINNLKLKKIMSFDQGNEKLINVLDQIGVPLNKKIIQNSKLIISEDNYKYFNT
jgi:hypothetical protein